MAPSSLDSYHRKRDFSRTAEPRGRPGDAPPADGPRFVLQEHHATALHWDLRLERNGVGPSWALPKGMPLERGLNHLAVQTEDHPLSYFSFDGAIPEGEYGGGRVIVWDAGTYELHEWTDDKVSFTVHGRRVDGRYTLFRTKGKHWMIRRKDEVAGYTPMPELVRPMLASAGALPAKDDGWAFEMKWDGVRAVVYVDGGRARVLTRNDREVVATYPELRAMAESLGGTRVILDGEIVAFDELGRPNFGSLQARMHVARPTPTLLRDVPVTYLAFDVLYLDGELLTGEPYSRRREILESLGLHGPHWLVPPSFPGPGADVFAASKAQGLEGLLIKRLDSLYHAGKRSDSWLKVKHQRTQSCVIGGWKPGEGNREGRIGSLLLGVYDDTGALHYAGHVGTGFSQRTLADLGRKLDAIVVPESPFTETVPREHARNAHWVRPELVCEVQFTEWTKDGRLRHPSYQGLRADIEAKDVRREP
ncbi:MAG: polymerase LigD, ligase domain protein [Frankiales bacterium]|nr:polymerase LigD, ligase domain protein [Frankiales bacterium]